MVVAVKPFCAIKVLRVSNIAVSVRL
jgi:hypothetical protein